MTKKRKNKGWRNEPVRHALASRGIPTKMKANAKHKDRDDEFEKAKQYRLSTTEEEVKSIFEELFPEEDIYYNWGDANFDVHGGVAVQRWNDELYIFQVSPTEGAIGQKERMELIEDNMSYEEILELMKKHVPESKMRDLMDEWDIDTLEEMLASKPTISLEWVTDAYSGPYIIGETYTDAKDLAEYINNFPEEESQLRGWAEIEIHSAEELKDMTVEDFVRDYIRDSPYYATDPYVKYRDSNCIGQGLFKEMPFEVE